MPGSSTSRVRTPKAPSWVPKGVRAGTCVPSFKICPPCPWRIPTGAPPSPCRQFTGLVRSLFIAGARDTFILELKVTRTCAGWKKWTPPGRGPTCSRAGRPKKGQRQHGKYPERPLLWIVTKALHRWGQIGSPLSAQSVSVCGFNTFLSLCPALFIMQAVKHETLTQCWANVGPPSTTLSQH